MKLLLSECATVTHNGLEFDCVQLHILDSEGGVTYTTEEVDSINESIIKLAYEVEHEK